MSFRRNIVSLFMALVFVWTLSAQQNPSLFLMHQVPESNLLNPAIPISCKYYIGLPVFSSVHLNYGNSFLTYNQLFRVSESGSRTIDIDQAVSNMHNRNFIGTEAHVQLLALGYRHRNYSFMFTITEKDNIPTTIPKNGTELLWNGNTQFEGEKAGMKGAGIYFNHYREYAVSASKSTRWGTYWGVRAKLLFGKLNLSSTKANLGVHTNSRTFDLDFDGKFNLNSSLPVIIHSSGSSIDSIVLDDNVSRGDLIFNRKNPGFSIDAGVIYPYNSKLTLSASVIDLGFIWWKSNLNSLRAEGEFTYTGTLGAPSGSGSYYRQLVNTFLDSMNVDLQQDRYVGLLPVHLIAGADYKINDLFSAGIVGEANIFRSRVNPSLTFMGQYKPLENVQLTASYTLQYNSYTNFGLGLVLGKDPVQFYIVSTNVPGFIDPLNTQSLNIRFGLNILLGCNLVEDMIGGKGRSSMDCKGMDVPVKSYEKKIKKRKKKR